jgi:hypothetical protein
MQEAAALPGPPILLLPVSHLRSWGVRNSPGAGKKRSKGASYIFADEVTVTGREQFYQPKHPIAQ